jgi:hypothetical protein
MSGVEENLLKTAHFSYTGAHSKSKSVLVEVTDIGNK